MEKVGTGRIAEAARYAGPARKNEKRREVFVCSEEGTHAMKASG